MFSILKNGSLDDYSSNESQFLFLRRKRETRRKKVVRESINFHIVPNSFSFCLVSSSLSLFTAKVSATETVVGRFARKRMREEQDGRKRTMKFKLLWAHKDSLKSETWENNKNARVHRQIPFGRIKFLRDVLWEDADPKKAAFARTNSNFAPLKFT